MGNKIKIKINEILKNSNMVIHTPHKEDAEDLCHYLHERGLCWSDGDIYDGMTMWDKYEENTCYCVACGGYGNFDFYQNERYTIVEFEDVEFSQNKLKVGDKIRIRKDLETDIDGNVIDSMLEYQGKIATITDIIEDMGRVFIDLDYGEYYWLDYTYDIIDDSTAINHIRVGNFVKLNGYAENNVFFLRDDDGEYFELIGVGGQHPVKLHYNEVAKVAAVASDYNFVHKIWTAPAPLENAVIKALRKNLYWTYDDEHCKLLADIVEAVKSID